MASSNALTSAYEGFSLFLAFSKLFFIASGSNLTSTVLAFSINSFHNAVTSIPKYSNLNSLRTLQPLLPELTLNPKSRVPSTTEISTDVHVSSLPINSFISSTFSWKTDLLSAGSSCFVPLSTLHSAVLAPASAKRTKSFLSHLACTFIRYLPGIRLFNFL